MTSANLIKICSTRGIPIPVLKPKGAMFEGALAKGGNIGTLATFAPSVGSMEDEFCEMADAIGLRATIQTYCVLGAMAALKASASSPRAVTRRSSQARYAPI